MTLRNLVSAFLLASAATTAAFAAPANAQTYGFSNGWRQPIQSGPRITPTQSLMNYRPSRPVMNQRLDFDSTPRFNRQRNFGNSSFSTFGF